MIAGLSFPIRHLSVRVPWHDSGWNGTVCVDPKNNVACLKWEMSVKTPNMGNPG